MHVREEILRSVVGTAASGTDRSNNLQSCEILELSQLGWNKRTQAVVGKMSRGNRNDHDDDDNEYMNQEEIEQETYHDFICYDPTQCAKEANLLTEL
jgi:hypothetical protein